MEGERVSATLLTFLAYAIPASLLAGLTMWVGRERKIRFGIAEYFCIYIPFLLVFMFIFIMFGSIDRGVEEMELGVAGTLFIALTGGTVAGTGLLPRLFIAEKKLRPLVLSSASSFLIGMLCLKMFFLMVVVVNPKSLLAG